MSNSSKTWKVTYSPKILNGGIRGVAIIEADTKQWAIYTFQQLYAGQYYTIDKCEPLF